MRSYCCSTNISGSSKIDSLSSLLELVGENNRLQILCILKKGKHCVCEINKHIKASQSLISHHLKDLKNGGLIIDDKKGLNVFYSLTSKGKFVTTCLFRLIDKEVLKK